MPVVHGDARRGALDARPRQHAAAGDERRSSATRSCRTRACTRCSICASNAAPARANARSASMWRDSRASFCLAIGIATACRCGARAFGSAHARRGVGQPVRAALERDCRQRRSRSGSPRRPSASIGGASLPQWTRQTLRKRAQDGDQGRGPRTRARCCSPTRSPITPIRRSVSPRSRCMNAAGIATQRRAERLLRPAADLAGRSAGGPPARRGQRPRAVRCGGARPRDRVCRAELPVGGARRCARSAARRAAATRPRGGAASRCCSKSFSKPSARRAAPRCR